MTLTVSLSPEEEAQLLAQANRQGLSPDALVGEVVKLLLTSASSVSKEPKRSLLGLLASYGRAPSAEEIDQSRAEMFAGFERDDIG